MRRWLQDVLVYGVLGVLGPFHQGAIFFAFWSTVCPPRGEPPPYLDTFRGAYVVYRFLVVGTTISTCDRTKHDWLRRVFAVAWWQCIGFWLLLGFLIPMVGSGECRDFFNALAKRNWAKCSPCYVAMLWQGARGVFAVFKGGLEFHRNVVILAALIGTIRHLERRLKEQ